VGEAELAALDDVEARLVEARVSPERRAAIGSGPQAELNALRKVKVSDRPYSLRLYSLSGEAYLLAGDSTSARSMLRSADGLSNYGQAMGVRDPAPVLRALLMPDLAKRRDMLESSASPLLWGSDPKAVPPRIRCELALLYLDENRYEEARNALEAAFPLLTPGLRAAYQPLVDAASKGLQAGIKRETADIAEADPLDMGLLARAVVMSEPSIVPARPDALPDDRTVLTELIAAGFILPEKGGAQPDPLRTALRRDAVRPLFALYLRRTGEKGLEHRYTEKYAPKTGEGAGRSPLPDVPFGSEGFDATLALIEREIMDLPDGALFYPDAALSGISFLEMLARLPAAKVK
jgi:tetratricopeptide (TPR) repeat protein